MSEMREIDALLASCRLEAPGRLFRAIGKQALTLGSNIPERPEAFLGVGYTVRQPAHWSVSEGHSCRLTLRQLGRLHGPASLVSVRGVADPEGRLVPYQHFVFMPSRLRQAHGEVATGDVIVQRGIVDLDSPPDPATLDEQLRADVRDGLAAPTIEDLDELHGYLRSAPRG